MSAANFVQKHQRNFTHVDSNFDSFTQSSGASGATISSGSGTRSAHGRHRRGTNSISLAGQIVTGVANRQIVIPSIVQSASNKTIDSDQQAPERNREEPENFYFGSPQRRQNQQKAQMREQQLINMQINPQPFNIESPDKQFAKGPTTDDLFQIELMTQESTPDKEHLDRSNSNNQLSNSIYNSSPQLDPAFTHPPHQQSIE